MQGVAIILYPDFARRKGKQNKFSFVERGNKRGKLMALPGKVVYQFSNRTGKSQLLF